MKLILAILLLCSCTAVKPVYHTQQVKYVRTTSDTLVFISVKHADSVYLLYKNTKTSRFIPGQRYLIKADSSRYQLIAGRKYYSSTLKRLQ